MRHSRPKPRTTRAPDPSGIGRAPSARRIALRVPRWLSAHSFEYVLLDGRDERPLLARVRDAIATGADIVQLTLPRRPSRTYTLSADDARVFLANLEEAIAGVRDAEVELPATPTDGGPPMWARLSCG